MHRTIRKVTEDIEALRFNTAISAMMVLNNELHSIESPPKQAVETLLLLLAPMAPHLAEELWERIGNAPSIQRAAWPAFDPALCEEPEVVIPVQINGKVRGKIRLPKGADEVTAKEKASAQPGVARHLEGKELIKVRWVQDRILTLVVK